MFDVQYEFFRDLDRRCLSEGLTEAQCVSVVELKRKAIDSALNRSNPLVADVLGGKTTFVATYDGFSHAFRGLRRFVPKTHDAAWNERLEQLARIVPNVRHFRRRSLFAADNPTTLTLYGIIAGAAAHVVLTGDLEPGETAPPLVGDATTCIAAIAGLGFVFGTAAMFKYRIRDYKHIHAREAAGYMDLNYGFFRSGDTRGWTECLRAEATAARAKLARPD
ncbi:MAG TPA: hypothetical protein VK163_01535 [Opitutaceae bacterium]|nr:hypothetical protein [Opitutaceae bacterium]